MIVKFSGTRYEERRLGKFKTHERQKGQRETKSSRPNEFECEFIEEWGQKG